MEMAKIGPGIAGGNNRQTLTDEDAEGRALFQSWCEAAGMTMGVDTMGNMFATRAGEDPDALVATRPRARHRRLRPDQDGGRRLPGDERAETSRHRRRRHGADLRHARAGLRNRGQSPPQRSIDR